MRETTFPIIQSLKIMVFGDYAKATQEEYDTIYNNFEQNMKVYQEHLKTKRMYMVGASLTISDIFLVLMLTEMYQCIMNPLFRGQIPNINKLFKHVTLEVPEFRQIMGNIKQS